MAEAELLRLLYSADVRGQLDWTWAWTAVSCDAGETTGWLVSVRFTRPDRDSGEMGIGVGRPLFIPADATTRMVLGTAFTAIKLVVEHELLEGFHVGEARVFDPHAPLGAS